MKIPRIYLYYSNPEFRGFVVPDLRSLVKDLGELDDRPAFIHVGFQHIDSEKVFGTLNELPPGVYCSDTFLGCDPGEKWKFSTRVATVAYNYSVHFISHSPVFERPEPIELNNMAAKTIHSVRTGCSHDEKRVIKDRPIASFEWSVRAINVFNTKQIENLSDMVGLTERDFLSFQNFGRKTMAEVESNLAEVDLSIKDLTEGKILFAEPEPDQSSGDHSIAPCNHFYDDIYARFKETCEERDLSVFEMRIGVRGAPATLKTVGDKLGFTRERARQIEIRAWKRALARLPNPIDAWYYELEHLVAMSLFPLSVSDTLSNDHRFTNDVKTRELLKYLFRYYPKYGRPRSDEHLQLVPYAGEAFVTRLTENDINELRDVIERRLIDSSGQNEKTIKEGLWAILHSDRAQFAELIWRKLWPRALTKENDGELILVKYLSHSDAERACESMILHIEELGRPISNAEVEEFFVATGVTVSLRSCFNFMAVHTEIFPSRHGAWSTIGLLSPTPQEIRTVNDIIENMSTGEREEFHSRELITRLKKLDIDRFDEFQVTGILRNQKKYTYLGRNVFACPGSQLERRTKIHDILVRILQSENRPLHSNELISKASKLRSIDPGMQIQAKPPIVLLGANIFGLDFWDA